MKTAFFWVVEIDGDSIESTYLTAPVWLSCRWLTAFPRFHPHRVSFTGSRPLVSHIGRYIKAGTKHGGWHWTICFFLFLSARLYALDSCLQNATFVHTLDDLPLLNMTMTQKETSHWLESTIQLHAEEIRLRETEPLTAAEIAAEGGTAANKSVANWKNISCNITWPRTWW